MKILNKAKIFHSDIQYLPFCSNKKLFIPGDPDMHAADQWQLSSRNHSWGELASIKMEGYIDVRRFPALDLKKGDNMTCIELLQVDVADLYECGDVRKFLTIVAKSNLFR